MSQEGILDIVSSHPAIPILFVENTGTATPALNELNIIGGTGISTSGSGNTVTISFTGAPSNLTLTGNSGGAISAIANNINTVGTGSITISGAGNTLTTQLTGLTNHSVQIGAGSATLTQMPVGSNGQVIIGSNASDPAFGTLTSPDGSITFTAGPNTLTLQVSGGTTVGKTITGQSGGALSPTAGNWNIFGASTAAGTSPVTSSGAGSTLTLNVQKSQAIAATDATKIGLSNFNSAQFSVDANGFVSTSGTGILNTLTGNSGGAISPAAGNINTLGTGSITIAGSGSTLTTQLTGLTNHSVQVGAGTATLTQLSVGTNGQVLIGATTADPAFATLTSSDSSISFTTGANTLSLQVAGGSTTIKTITGNTGGAESPSAGNFNILGTGSITVAGSANTETVQLTGLTNHAIQIGAGTATLTQLGAGTTGQVLQTNTTADPTWSTATYPSTTTINQILYSSSANVVGGLATANNGVLTTGTSGIPVITALASNGQLIIGSGAGAPAAATLTAGTGISITNGANSITIAASGEGLTWSVKSTNFNAAVSNGYFITGNAVATLPAAPSIGDTIAFFVQGAFTVTITGNTGQAIQISSNLSTAAGTQANTATGDACTLVYDSTNTQWNAVSFVGAWNKT
jgi:hypothetical protein